MWYGKDYEYMHLEPNVCWWAYVIFFFQVILCNISCGYAHVWWSQIAKFMGPTWGPPGSCQPQMGPMLAPWTLLTGIAFLSGLAWLLPQVVATTTGVLLSVILVILSVHLCVHISCDFYPRPVLAFGYCHRLRLWVCVSVCVYVCVCINHELVRTITHRPFQLGSPNLDQRCKTPWFRSLLFLGMLDLDLQGQI